MDDWLLVYDVVDWDSGVDDLLLDDLALDDWLDCLVYVVVGNILTDGCNLLCRSSGWVDSLGVLVCGLLVSKSLLCSFSHLVSSLSVLDWKNIVLVDFSLLDFVQDGLYSLLVVVDVVFPVLDYLNLLMLVSVDGLLYNSWGHSLVCLSGSGSVLP